MPLFSSTLPLRALLALTQAGDRGLSLREVAKALDVVESSTQHALKTLREEGVTTVLAGGRPRYVLRRTDPTEELARLSARYLPIPVALSALTRANRGVEFASYDADTPTLYVVYAEDAGPNEELLLGSALRRLPDVRLVAARHDLFVEATLQDPSLRERVLGGRILKGSAARSLPDRTRRGDFRRAPRLGRPHPSVPRLSHRRLADLARRYGLRRIGLFGSAVRRDFRPDSDVDVVVRYAPGARPSLDERVALEHELERLLQRDVDLIDADALREELRPRVEAEEVPLYGRA